MEVLRFPQKGNVRMGGFTLLEVLMALAVLGIALIGIAPFLVASTGGVLGAYPAGFQAGRQSKDYILATESAQAIMEYFVRELTVNWAGYPEGCPVTATIPSNLKPPAMFSVSVNIKARTWNNESQSLNDPTCTSPGGTYVKQVEVDVTWSAGGAPREVNLKTLVAPP
jgi:prepilin-type N-terminal cleavage/methylation domain-containing protein